MNPTMIYMNTSYITRLISFVFYSEMIDVVQNCLGQLVVRLVSVLQTLLQSVHTGNYEDDVHMIRDEKEEYRCGCDSPITGKVLHCSRVCTLFLPQPQSVLLHLSSTLVRVAPVLEVTL